jgi:PGAP1-like protein
MTMDSQATLLEFLLQYRSTLIGIVSIAIAAIVFWMIKSRLGKNEFSDFPNIVVQDLLALRHRGEADMQAILVAMGKIAKSRWAGLSLVAAVLALLVGLIFKYVADASSKKIIETTMNFPAQLCKRTTRDSVLLFLHGWNGDIGETWQQFPRLACDDPSLSRTDVISVGYPTYMKKSGYTVVETAMWIYQELLERTALKETDKVAIIAHSMGGLIAREIALKSPTSKIQLHIVAITTISSPHNGTDIGSIAHGLGVSSHYTLDMKHGSSMLTSLHARWNDTDPKYRPRRVCFGGIADHVVDTDSAFFQCDEQYKIQQWGHSELVKPLSRDDERYRRPINHVVKALKDPESNAAKN